MEGSANSKAYPFSCKSVPPPFAGRYRPDEAVAGEVRSEHWKRTTSTSGAKRQSSSSQSFPASAGPLPRSPHRHPTTDSHKIIHPKKGPEIVRSGTFCVDMRDRPLCGSGRGPERALEANNLHLWRKAPKLILPELPCERRTTPAEPPPRPSHSFPQNHPPKGGAANSKAWHLLC